MKQLKIISLVAVAVTMQLVGAGTASATMLTSPQGTNYTGGGLKLLSEEKITIRNETIAETKCDWTLEGKSETHGPAVTAVASLSALSLENCSPKAEVTVTSPGSLEFHTDTGENGNGVVTWVGAQLTIKYTMVGITCVYTSGTGITFGTLTGSNWTGGPATLELGTVKIPRTGGGAICGSNGIITGNFQVATPITFYVD
jgi:hypothetical protein